MDDFPVKQNKFRDFNFCSNFILEKSPNSFTQNSLKNLTGQTSTNHFIQFNFCSKKEEISALNLALQVHSEMTQFCFNK